MTAQYARQSSDQFRYVIVAPSFDENSGGVIALRYLCHMLNESGVNASLVEMPPADSPSRLRALARSLKHAVKSLIKERYGVHPALNTPVNHLPIDSRTIVVYPEVLGGNPLGATNVVRWFLDKPGHITGQSGLGLANCIFSISGLSMIRNSIATRTICWQCAGIDGTCTTK